jgi:hypothetical protein
MVNHDCIVTVMTSIKDILDQPAELGQIIASNVTLTLPLADAAPKIESIEEARVLLFADPQRVIMQCNGLECWITRGIWDDQHQGMVAAINKTVVEISQAVFDELSQDPRLAQCRCSQFFQQRAADSTHQVTIKTR